MSFSPGAVYSELSNVTRWHWVMLIQLWSPLFLLHGDILCFLSPISSPGNTYLGCFWWNKPLLFPIKSHMGSDGERTGKGISPSQVPWPEYLPESVLHISAQLFYFEVQIAFFQPVISLCTTPMLWCHYTWSVYIHIGFQSAYFFIKPQEMVLGNPAVLCESLIYLSHFIGQR